MKKILLFILLAMPMLAFSAIETNAAYKIEIFEQDINPIQISIDQDNKLHISGANGQIAYIYNVVGKVIATIKIDGPNAKLPVTLERGCYIVKVGTVVRKVYVKQ